MVVGGGIKRKYVAMEVTEPREAEESRRSPRRRMTTLTHHTLDAENFRGLLPLLPPPIPISLHWGELH